MPAARTATLRLASAGGWLLVALGAAHAAPPQVWQGDGVPPPRPVASRVPLGVYIFPGWYRDAGRGDYPYRTHDEDSEWRQIARVPRPRPLLGFYDDSLPAVNDWHIKWALEHGISFFCFDWYWNAGEHRLLRTLEQGFLQARYNPMMKFCLNWCNHGLDWRNRPWNRPTDEDFQTPALVEMTRYMVDHYFTRPNYLTVAGRPVLIVWDTRRLIDANGGPVGFRQALAAMNQVLRDNHLGDLYLIAVGDYGDNAAAGFAATTDYGYYGTDYDSPYEWRSGYSTPYEAIMQHHATMWRNRRAGVLPYMLTLGSNWDNRPRAGDGACVVTGKSPEKYAALCTAALKQIDPRNGMAIVEAWNEWGEGSFIEPDREWGFGFLDALRSTFTTARAPHTDLIPSPECVARLSLLQGDELAAAGAAGSLPYPDPPVSRRLLHWTTDAPLPAGPVLKRWEFSGSDADGWSPYQMTPLAVHGGVLSATPTGTDPQISVDNVGVAVENLACVAFRLRAAPGVSMAQMFWSTAAEPALSAGKCFTFPLPPDGKWHEVQVSQRPRGSWRGPLKLLRLDIGGPGERLDLDWVRLYGKAQ